ncbi:MAG: LysE family translocator [Rhizobiaceae bacterium]
MIFVPDPAILAAYLAGTFIIVMTPGPDMTYFLGCTMRQGKMAGVAAMVGALSGVLVHAMLVALGLSALLVTSPRLFFILKVAGALYLLWLAIDAIRHGSVLSVNAGSRRVQSLGRIWLQGAGIDLLNPKVVLFFMTFLPQFVSANDPHSTGKFLFLGVVYAIATFVLSLPIILAADQFTNWFKKNPRATRVLDWVFAGVFSTFAVRILVASRN